MRIKNLSHEKIEQGLENATQSVKKILEKLGVDASIATQELYDRILDDLEGMNYKVFYDDILINIHLRQSVPALTVPNNNENRENGGTIKLNRNYPTAARLEALFHEYVHIKDATLPIISALENDSSMDIFLSGRLYMEPMENMVDFTTYTLIMPPAQIKKDLLGSNYNIDKILNKYSYFEKCTVLQWITINSLVACHFSWVMLVKIKGNKVVRKVYDACFYDRQNNPGSFDIEAILSIQDSAVARSLEKRKNENRQTTIKDKLYQCYAYYEDNLKKEICTIELESTTVNYDRLLVIGWEKAAYVEMEKTMNDAKEILNLEHATNTTSSGEETQQ